MTKSEKQEWGKKLGDAGNEYRQAIEALKLEDSPGARVRLSTAKWKVDEVQKGIWQAMNLKQRTGSR